MTKKQDNQKKEVGTTGHKWDGIEEYNNPLPRWWLWTFYVSIIFSVGYCIYYPSWPTINGFLEGKLGWSQYSQLAEEKLKAAEMKKAYNAQLAAKSVDEILQDPELSNFAIAAGRAEFALNCSQCHGLGAAGAKGYPNLLDDEWLWGGEIEDIVYTITHGIRSYETDDETRDSMMTGWGDEELLTKEEIADVVRYLKVISEGFMENDASERGAEIFAENCTSCHGENGQGMHEMGAPALNNAVWLYGGHTTDLIQTITHGRGGVMPAFGAKLDAETIKKLAIYVFSLSGGEKVE